jgi:hypothetical protein
MQPGQPPTRIGELLDRYLLDLDEGRLDDEWARSLFTDDARVEFPMSSHAGITGLASYHRDALSAFAGTQHLNSPSVVTLTGPDTATLRANLMSTHVHHAGAATEPLFATGTMVTGEARRTADGWRLGALSFRVVWTAGSPPRASVTASPAER